MFVKSNSSFLGPQYINLYSSIWNTGQVEIFLPDWDNPAFVCRVFLKYPLLLQEAGGSFSVFGFLSFSNTKEAKYLVEFFSPDRHQKAYVNSLLINRRLLRVIIKIVSDPCCLFISQVVEPGKPHFIRRHAFKNIFACTKPERWSLCWCVPAITFKVAPPSCFFNISGYFFMCVIESALFREWTTIDQYMTLLVAFLNRSRKQSPSSPTLYIFMFTLTSDAMIIDFSGDEVFKIYSKLYRCCRSWRYACSCCSRGPHLVFQLVQQPVFIVKSFQNDIINFQHIIQNT